MCLVSKEHACTQYVVYDVGVQNTMTFACSTPFTLVKQPGTTTVDGIIPPVSSTVLR